MTKRSLTDEEVKEIQSAWATRKYTLKELAEEYNCSIMTISLWKDVETDRRDIKFGPRIIKAPPVFDSELLQRVRQLKREGLNSVKIGHIIGIDLKEVNEMFVFLAGETDKKPSNFNY